MHQELLQSLLVNSRSNRSSNCYRVKRINVFYISDYRFTHISSISIACSLLKEGKSCTTTRKRIPQNCKIKSPERKRSL